MENGEEGDEWLKIKKGEESMRDENDEVTGK